MKNTDTAGHKGYDARTDQVSRRSNSLHGSRYENRNHPCPAPRMWGPQGSGVPFRGAAKAMGGGAVFRLAGKVPPTLEELRKLNTSLQMVVLAFTVLILKRL